MMNSGQVGNNNHCYIFQLENLKNKTDKSISLDTQSSRLYFCPQVWIYRFLVDRLLENQFLKDSSGLKGTHHLYHH